MLCVKILYRIFESEEIASGFPVLVYRSNHCSVSLQFYFYARTRMPTGTHLHTHLLTHVGDECRHILYTQTPSYKFLFSFENISWKFSIPINISDFI